MSSALRLLSHNATRLYKDAALLHEYGRYPTSLSLSVLSIEESGKFFIRKRTAGNTESAAVRHHVPKQHEALSWLATEETILAFFDVLQEFGFEHKAISEMTALQQDWIVSAEGVDFDNRLRGGEVLEVVIGAVHRRMHEARIVEDLRRVSMGEINKLKQLGFYLDADGTAEALVLPQAISEQEASWWLRKAKRAAELTTMYGHDSTSQNRFATAPFHLLLEKSFNVPF